MSGCRKPPTRASTVKYTAPPMGISRGQIYRWRRQLAEESGNIRAFPGTGKARDEELAQLKRELAIVREEREILRKVVAIFSRPKK